MLALVRARLLQLLLVLFFMSILIFGLMKLAPGDPVFALLKADEVKTTMADEQALRESLGLDKPMLVQYGQWLARVARLDFGDSLMRQRPVLELYVEKLPATVELALGGMAFMLALAVPAGLLAARFPGRLPDHAGRAFSLLGASIPVFWIGLLLIYLFAYRLQWLPFMGRGEDWRQLILPSVTLGFGLSAVHASLLRSGMLASLSQPYIRAARARGIRESTIYGKYALRGAIAPVLTVFGMTLGSLLAGSVVVETLFSWPGIGLMAVEAIFQRDYPLVQGFLFLSGALIVLVNLAVDLLYGWIDPRVRLSGKGGRR
ncbi:nickel ABC transporter permease [Paenibacillus sp. B01]|uniref:nickel ABC transporter permease n=1 Tax=Paenibacillus sp. B01 TaxID=2660554 RepID=UPI00129B8F68|nr:nickel ABC transporter permease [Paenibacillus sp. B01]QGG55219.1 ABC transporter permease subunit [Paenibacillus sp. B01]